MQIAQKDLCDINFQDRPGQELECAGNWIHGKNHRLQLRGSQTIQGRDAENLGVAGLRVCF